MKELYTELVELKANEQENTHIEITVTYNSEKERRGYYMYVMPVKIQSRGGYSVKTYGILQSGERLKLLSCARASKANEQKALDLAEFMKTTLINNVVEANDFELKQGVTRNV